MAEIKHFVVSRRLLAWCFALVLSACGGGAEVPSSAGASSSLAQQTQMRAAAPLAATPSAEVSATLANRLMDFGESALPQYFPGHPATQATAGFLFRAYSTGVYLGVVVDPSFGLGLYDVYVMGGAFGPAPRLVGPLTNFISASIVTGIVLQDDAAIQTNGSPYSLRGQVLLEPEGPPPRLRITTTGPLSGSADVDLAGTQFDIPVPLGVGDTKVEVIALDGSANPLKYTKQVTLNAVALINGNLELSATQAFISTSTSITARVAIAPAALVAGSAKLVEVLPNGNEVEVATLVDTGSLNAGDEVQGDGVYSAKFTLFSAVEGTKNYRVRAQALSGPTARSAIRSVSVTGHFSGAELTTIKNTQLASSNRLKLAEAQGPAALKAAVTDEVLALKANPLVAEAAANESGTALSVLYKNGIGGVIGQPGSGLKGGASFAATERASPLSLSPLQDGLSTPYQAYCPPPGGGGAATSDGSKGPLRAATAATTGPAVGNNRVLAIAANYSQAGWGENDDVPQLAALLKSNKCLDVTYIKSSADGDGSVENFKNLGQYGIVLISTHGDTHFKFLGQDLFSGSLPWEYAPKSAQVVIYSNMEVTTANRATYEADLKAGRLVIWNGMYGIMPSFIKKYSGKMADSLIYMSICRGAWNNTMADAFIGTGAKAFIGYSNYVGVGFTAKSGIAFFTEWMKPDKTVADGYAQVNPKFEGGEHNAEFRVVGDQSLKGPASGLHDGGFESGSLGSWKSEGDGRIVRQLGAFTPTAGTFMAVISTGLGFTTGSGTLSQLLCLGTETTLTYKWNFFSEEFLEYVGSQFQDSFTVTITDAANPANKVTVQADTVDSLAGGVTKVSNSFDQGDVYATGWRTKTFTIPAALRGKTVIIKFAVADVGDSAYDSAVLLDEISIQ